MGNFIGLMPQDMRSAGRVTAVEREPMAATIARALYPMQNIQLVDFTEFKGNDGYFDAVVGNPPFASDPQTDSSGRKHLTGLTLHNFFFAKGVDMLREGGILAQVVTSGCLDAQGDRARRYIGDPPSSSGPSACPTTHSARTPAPRSQPTSSSCRSAPESEWGSKAWGGGRGLDGCAELDIRHRREAALNQYFHDHPEMMLGEFGPYGTMYRKGFGRGRASRAGHRRAAEGAVARLPERLQERR